ncbi:hypothetical protein [Halococcoides cellulosivorans]|uniref:Uncharacterized protein n=1 Tax=Halococcoides cellulosivorans TaxID=1679096 RepID=A0A2R4X0Y1_9EURY|nr:hypothetical protein [Halococcoides cellulosivorans]AWB27436.1 hypothetical protein HARCEL1_06820 [Halococcoides cellulosivorans]
MTDNTKTMVDRIAMGVGGGLLLLSTVVIGLIEVLAGNNVPLYVGTNADGETVQAATAAGMEVVNNAPVVPPNLRALILVIGLAVLGGYAIFVVGYGAMNGVPGYESSSSTAETFE